MNRRNFLKISIGLAASAIGLRRLDAGSKTEIEELTSQNSSKLRYGDAVAYLQGDKLKFGMVDNRYIHESWVSVADVRNLGQHAGIPYCRSVIGLTLDGRVLVGRNFQNRRDLPEIIKKLDSMRYRR